MNEAARGFSPCLIAIKSNRKTWESYDSTGMFVWGEHFHLLEPDDRVFQTLRESGQRPIAVCEFETIEQLHSQLVSTYYSVNNPLGGVTVYPRRWTSADVNEFVEMQTGPRMTIRASLQLGSEFCLTEESRNFIRGNHA